MKKTYIAPMMETVEYEPVQLLTGSGVNADGIGFGGVDSEGTMDPSAPGMMGLPSFVFQ
ncbi:MAG: hypothetical protein IJ614_03055 [Prevotella sp.]|nr:hypothetical protein [Prevotella sp.]